MRTAESYSSDQYSQVEVTSTQLTGGQWVGPAVRLQPGGQNGYLGIYFWNSGSPVLRLYKRTAGSWTQLGSGYSCGALAAGTRLEVAAMGSRIAFLVNGVQRISVTDSSFTGGRPGIMAFGSADADNWSGGNGASYSVGGTVSGLSGTVVLQDNGGDNLSVSASGSFTFASPVADGAAYSVTVKTNPSGQACTVTSGSGTVGGGQRHQCRGHVRQQRRSYSVGGTVSGLSGTVVLQDNGGDNLSVSASGSFTFAIAGGRRGGLQRDGEDEPVGPGVHGHERLGDGGRCNVTNVAVTCTYNGVVYGRAGLCRGCPGRWCCRITAVMT